MKTSKIKKMSKADRLKMMEDIWDTLYDEEGIESPSWHKEILDDRKRQIDEGEANFISNEKLKKR